MNKHSLNQGYIEFLLFLNHKNSIKKINIQIRMIFAYKHTHIPLIN